MSTILITGGTGLIGAEVIRRIGTEHAIYAVSRRQNNLLSMKTRIISCDLSKPFDDSLFPAEIDAVIHLAQSEHFRDFPARAADVFNVNTRATFQLLDYARRAGARTFIYASSGGVYGSGASGFDENTPIVARSGLGFYQSSKLCSEILADNYTSLMNVIMLRFFFVYGPEQKPSMLIPRLVESVRNGTPISLQGESGIRINPTYVSDAADAVIGSLALIDSHKINIGGPDVLSLREIATEIGEQVGREPVFSIDKQTQPGHLIGDIGKMRSLLFSPKISFKKGIADLITS